MFIDNKKLLPNTGSLNTFKITFKIIFNKNLKNSDWCEKIQEIFCMMSFLRTPPKGKRSCAYSTAEMLDTLIIFREVCFLRAKKHIFF